MFISYLPETRHVLQTILNVVVILGPVALFVGYLFSRTFRRGPSITPTYLRKTDGTLFRFPGRDVR